MVHLTETCAPDLPRLVVHTDTAPANAHEAMRTRAIHAGLAGLAGLDLIPSEHLVDAAYVSAVHLVAARERHGAILFGPARPKQGWQTREEGAFHVTDFAVDWEHQRERCPEGRESTSWRAYRVEASGRPFIRAGFSPALCRVCSAKPRCTREASHRLSLHPRAEHETRAGARTRLESYEGRRLYGQRQGIEATISQGVRRFYIRRARYRGLAKTTLQSVATAAALNLDRPGRVVRAAAAGPHTPLTLRGTHGLAAGFANSVRRFSRHRRTDDCGRLTCPKRGIPPLES